MEKYDRHFLKQGFGVLVGMHIFIVLLILLAWLLGRHPTSDATDSKTAEQHAAVVLPVHIEPGASRVA